MGYINKNKSRIVEGELRAKELAMYLEKLGLPKIVWLSEDATSIEGKIQYDPHTNQMLGLVQPIDPCTGMPKTNAYMARNLNEIQQNMKGVKSMYAYVVMAQPLTKNAPPFPLQLFGSDNTFTTQNVLLRWKYTIEQLKR